MWPTFLQMWQVRVSYQRLAEPWLATAAVLATGYDGCVG